MELHAMNWAGIFSTVFLAIVFLQSGLDKALHYKRELGWIQQKFSRNALYAYIGTLFFLLTVFEIISGFVSACGVIMILAGYPATVAAWGAWFAVLTLLMLIFGQRITRDYSGAATLVPYFIAGLLALYFLS